MSPFWLLCAGVPQLKPQRFTSTGSEGSSFHRLRFTAGLTPYISNEVGMFVETTFDELTEDTLRNAVAGSTRTRLHRVRPKSWDLSKKSIKVAFPNDRAQSVRPTERHKPYK